MMAPGNTKMLLAFEGYILGCKSDGLTLSHIVIGLSDINWLITKNYLNY
jgi:hypothetical protein